MALDENRALAAIRLSAGRWTTETEIDDAAGQLAAAAIRLAPCQAPPDAGPGRGALTSTSGHDSQQA